jgi:DNA ligase-1
MLGKIFKGLTDEMLKWQTGKLLALETARGEWAVNARPEWMVEIAFNDIQQSPHNPGGLALRFARVKRFREEKSPLETDTLQKAKTIFESHLQ